MASMSRGKRVSALIRMGPAGIGTRTAMTNSEREAPIKPSLKAWSIQEHVGHLLDLESLWEQRLDDFDGGATVLYPADLENRKTHEANHNARDLEVLLGELRTARGRVVGRLERMSQAELSRVALHPRLQQPMSVVDLGYFVAEHDDHHLKTITELSR